MTLVRKGLLGTLALLLVLWVEASAQLARTPVIVDTDMDLDDLRAVALIFNSSHLQVKALVTSDGGLPPGEGARNLLRVLKFLGDSEVPVGKGKRLDKSPPRWRPLCETLKWEDLPAVPQDQKIPGAVPVIRRTLQKSKRKVTYVCLGPLSNLAGVLRQEPSVRRRLQSIYYYGTPPGAREAGWNTTRDPPAAAVVFTSGIPIFAFHLRESETLQFNLKLFHDIQRLKSRSARLIILLHRHLDINKLLRTGALEAWDDTVALYLNDPGLGNIKREPGKFPIFMVNGWDRKAARTVYLEILSGGRVR